VVFILDKLTFISFSQPTNTMKEALTSMSTPDNTQIVGTLNLKRAIAVR
jgi:hypothetical protein